MEPSLYCGVRSYSSEAPWWMNMEPSMYCSVRAHMWVILQSCVHSCHQNPKWLTHFSTSLQQFLSKTRGLSKWSEWCNMFKDKEKWMQNQIYHKNSAYRCVDISLFDRVQSTIFPLGPPCHQWLWMGFTNQITLYTLSIAHGQLMDNGILDNGILLMHMVLFYEKCPCVLYHLEVTQK